MAVDARYDRDFADRVASRLARIFRPSWRTLMATIDDLKTGVDNIGSGIASLDSKVDDLVTAYNSVKGGLSTADQAKLDSAVQALTAAKDSLTTEQGKVADALKQTPPPPPPTPAP